MSAFFRHVKRIAGNLKEIADKFRKDEVSVYAAQASFFMLLSFFPFLMLILTLIQLVPALQKSDVIDMMASIMPDMLDGMVIGIIDDLYVKSPKTIVSITAVAALWSASRGMQGIERGLNRVNEIPETHGFLTERLICVVQTLFFIVACVGSLLFLVLGNSINRMVQRWIPALSAFSSQLYNLRSLLSLLMLVIVFSGLYTWLPPRRRSMIRQIPGALFSTLGWIVFSNLFSVYFKYFNNYSYMYGSLTAVVVLMLWLYFCICILFIGAEINYHLGRFLDGKKRQT